MNKTYRDLILARAKTTVDNAKAVINIEHKGFKGELREIVIRDLLRPLLPADVGVGSGVIITADNRQSKQQDVVVYDKSILPPILLEGDKGIFPVESVIYTIEVKSILTASEIKTSHQSAIELVGFPYISGEHDKLGKPISHYVQKAISTIFAFATDLALESKTETERYDEIRGSDKSAIRVICVAGRGHWYCDEEDKWHEYPRKYEYAEVVSFVSVFMNTYRGIIATRKTPRLGQYLFGGEPR